jgi:precorrin-3B C17-methyltransferase
MSGKVFLIGIGPGWADDMTPRALSCLAQAQVVIGHKDCLELVSTYLKDKTLIEDHMSPLERSRLAAEEACSGEIVAILSTGHPGTYAIASTFFGYLQQYGLKVDTEVIPGLTLADYASAKLGSPLGNDLATISLADMADSWISIRKRLSAAAKADFVLVIYNPLGKLGTRRIKTAFEIISGSRAPDTPVALLSAAASKAERLQTVALECIDPESIAVDTLIIVGNSRTFMYEGKMITPRSYKDGVGY